MNKEQIIVLKTSLRNYFAGKGFEYAIKALREVCTYPGTRKDKITPVYVHMLCIANYLRGFDHLFIKRDVEASPYFDSLADTYFTVAMLHDSTEDRFTTYDDMKHGYGQKIVDYVSKLDKHGRSEDYYYEGLANCRVGSVVKGADRIHNCQTMVGVFSIDKQKSYIEETRRNVIPMIDKAADNFPYLDPVYDNIRLVLNSQIQLIEQMHEAIAQR